MKGRIFLALLFVCLTACNDERPEYKVGMKIKPDSKMSFDKSKWMDKDGHDYMYRDHMLNDILYNDSIRSISKDQILDLLGVPDRNKENHLYYRIAEKRLGFWTLHAKYLVVKISEKDTIEWIKVYE